LFKYPQLKDQQCGLGSVKTNIGHTTVASGLAALIKTALVLKHRALVPSLHFEKINPHIDIDNSPFYITKHYQPFPPEKKRLIAGVSNFGFGGTNAHLVLREHTI
jgi:acyl transferase domain-containing protein